MADASHGRSGTPLFAPSMWMVARERRQRMIYHAWVAGLVLTVMAGLTSSRWLWAPVAVVALRACLLATAWGWVLWARRATGRTGHVRVVVAVPRRHVDDGGWSAAYRPNSEPDEAYDEPEALVGGILEATSGAWIWRPNPLTACGARAFRLEDADVLDTISIPSVDPGMPPARYVQVILRNGRLIDLLVRDDPRAPSIRVPPV